MSTIGQNDDDVAYDDNHSSLPAWHESVIEWTDNGGGSGLMPTKSVFLHEINNIEYNSDDAWDAKVSYGVASNCSKLINHPMIRVTIDRFPKMDVVDLTKDELSEKCDAWESNIDKDRSLTAFVQTVKQHDPAASIHFVVEDLTWVNLVAGTHIAVYLPTQSSVSPKSHQEIAASYQQASVDNHHDQPGSAAVSDAQKMIWAAHKRRREREEGEYQARLARLQQSGRYHQEIGDQS
jgi:hypothetical protein